MNKLFAFIIAVYLLSGCSTDSIVGTINPAEETVPRELVMTGIQNFRALYENLVQITGINDGAVTNSGFNQLYLDRIALLSSDSSVSNLSAAHTSAVAALTTRACFESFRNVDSRLRVFPGIERSGQVAPADIDHADRQKLINHLFGLFGSREATSAELSLMLDLYEGLMAEETNGNKAVQMDNVMTGLCSAVSRSGQSIWRL